MTNRFTIFLASIFALVTTMAQKPSADESFQRSCPFVKIEPQRLPDLNIPRFGQAVFYANGELTVAGGHTSGFIPTPTAEYLKGGEWHLMQMTYNHDDGICVPTGQRELALLGEGIDDRDLSQDDIWHRCPLLLLIIHPEKPVK